MFGYLSLIHILSVYSVPSTGDTEGETGLRPQGADSLVLETGLGARWLAGLGGSGTSSVTHGKLLRSL